MERDVGVLISILSRAPTDVWKNVEQSMTMLRPRWSSLAIDLWDRAPSSSALRAQTDVHAAYASILARFSRTLFLNMAPRHGIPNHVRSSYSYRIHWLAAFGDSVARDGGFGYHSEGLPPVLIGLDADIHVPERLPVERIAATLEMSQPAAESAQAIRLADAAVEAARPVWVEGRKPPCIKAASLRMRQPKLQLPRGQLCDVVSSTDHPLFIAPRNLRRLREERDRSYLEMFNHFNEMGLGACCGRQNVAAAPEWRSRVGSAVATFSRGPWCPPSNFFLLHRRSLPRMLASLRTWQQAIDRQALFGDAKMYRWEYVGCSMLRPGESVLLAYYNHSELETARLSSPLVSTGTRVQGAQRQKRNHSSWASTYWEI